MGTIVQRIAGWRWSRVILILFTYVASAYFVLIGSFAYVVSTHGLTSTTGGTGFRILHFALTLPVSLFIEPLYQLQILSNDLALLFYILGPLLNALTLLTLISVTKHSIAKSNAMPTIPRLSPPRRERKGAPPSGNSDRFG